MQSPYANPLRHLTLCLGCNLLLPCALAAGNLTAQWNAQLYGGRYYDDWRIGAYGIASASVFDDFKLTGELLHEQYRNGDGDYIFSGIGGHLLWKAGEFARLGLAGSHAKEDYDYDGNVQDPKSEYTSSTAGLEAELDYDPLSLAVQAGKLSGDAYSSDDHYLTSDLYYWGDQYRWYARGALRRSKDYKEYTLEGYRTLTASGVPLSLYVGVTRNDLSTKQEILTYHTRYDSVYAGCYVDFLTTISSAWSLWLEAARQDTDTVFSLELTVSFGPGVDGPYISAFGFTP